MPATRSAFLFAAACAALLCAGSAGAAAPGDRYFAPDGLAQSDADGLALRPGEFLWLPAARERSDSPVTMLVSLRDQRGYLYRDGERIAVTTVSTGTPGHDTPTGVFPIMGKEPMHHSKKYDNAPMPWMQRLTKWGHALHAGRVRAGPASHGCVRLPAEFARQLYSLTRPGDLVVISQDDSAQALENAGRASQSEIMMAGAPVAPQRIADALRALGQPESAIAAEAGGAMGVTAY